MKVPSKVAIIGSTFSTKKHKYHRLINYIIRHIDKKKKQRVPGLPTIIS